MYRITVPESALPQNELKRLADTLNDLPGAHTELHGALEVTCSYNALFAVQDILDAVQVDGKSLEYGIEPLGTE